MHEKVGGRVSLPVRFDVRDIDIIRRRAIKDGSVTSVWIRDVCMGMTMAPMKIPKPTTSTEPKPRGPRMEGQLSIAFSMRDFDIIRKQAFKQRVTPSTWIRAAVKGYLDKGHTKS